MRVQELISRRPVTVPPELTVTKAAETMVKNGVGSLIVAVGSNIYGIVTERDIVRAAASGLPFESSIKDICTRKLVTVSATDDVGKAATLMAANRIRHLVVTDQNGSLLGVLSIRDLLAEKRTLDAVASSYGSEPFPGGD
ncbi:MAG: CBS domain-containing protein [Thermoprotei archaeon]